MNAAPRVPVPQAGGRRPGWMAWMLVGNLLVFVLAAALPSMALYASRATFKQRALDAADSLAQSLQLSIAAEMARVNLSLRTVALAHAKAAASGSLDHAALALAVEEQHSLLDEADSLRVTDAAGIVRFGRGVDPAARVDLSDRDYFMQARERPDKGLIVSEPLFARISQKWVIVLAYPLQDAQGRFAGVVYANLAASHFQALLARIDVGAHGAIALRSTNLKLLARHSPGGGPAPQPGGSNVSAELREVLLKHPASGTYIARTAVDQIERANAYRRVAPYPLVVLVGLATNDYLAQWRSEVALIAGLAGLVALLLTIFSVLLYRGWRRESASGAALLREQALRALTERHVQELDGLLKERSEMLDVMAHEVRQPLNNASAALQSAASALAEVGEQVAAQRLRRAQDVTGQVLASIDNTLAVASLLARPDPIERQDTDIDTLLAVAIADMPVGDRARIQVERVANTRTAVMDMSLMRLALRNLLSNALKYSPAGAVVRLRVLDWDEPLALVIEVIDQGAGVAPGLVPRLFERGARGAATSGAGHGLGLYIVRRVMELHRGRVEMAGSSDQGTTMRLVIEQAPDD